MRIYTEYRRLDYYVTIMGYTANIYLIKRDIFFECKWFIQQLLQ